MSTAILRHSRRDAVLIALALVHGALLVSFPSAPLIALGLWWNSNTVAHNFIHLPFFRSRAANRAFSVYLSLLLFLPQTLWRDRHLAHHADKPWRWRWSAQMGIELIAVSALWLFAISQGTAFMLTVWLPGWIGGLVLCTLQGHYEHVRGTVSHYGAFYNFAFFNDGYHVEHHARPGLHWTQLPRISDRGSRIGDRALVTSRWPAVLRWLEVVQLDALERLVLHSRGLQRFVVNRHARAFRTLLAGLPPVRRVTVVGGGLFPRTALVLKQLLPGTEITIIDKSGDNIQNAREFLGTDVRWVNAQYSPELCQGTDLLIVPLAFVGDRTRFYRDPPAPAVAVHDWIWHRHTRGVVISLFLLKRLNLVCR